MMHYVKAKRNITRISGLLLGIIIFTIITQLLNKMYVSYSYTSEAWGYILWHQFYENDGRIDNLYLGSSHVYCDIDPEILDEMTGECNFNLASPGQVLDGSYYLLKEADKNNQLSHVYLELYYEQNQNDTRIYKPHFNWHNTDYMHWSWNKVAYMLSIRGDGSIIDTLFPYTRYREYVGRWDYFTKVLAQKKGEDYRNYHWENDLGENKGRLLIREKGFMELTGCLKTRANISRFRWI